MLVWRADARSGYMATKKSTGPRGRQPRDALVVLVGALSQPTCTIMDSLKSILLCPHFPRWIEFCIMLIASACLLYIHLTGSPVHRL